MNAAGGGNYASRGTPVGGYPAGQGAFGPEPEAKFDSFR